MADFSVFTPAERALLAALLDRGVAFMVVGLSAAVLQGANTGTRDIDLWFEDVSDPRIADTAARVGTVVRAEAGVDRACDALEGLLPADRLN